MKRTPVKRKMKMTETSEETEKKEAKEASEETEKKEAKEVSEGTEEKEYEGPRVENWEKQEKRDPPQ